MKSQVILIENMLRDGAALCQVSAKQDIATLHRRFEHEGFPFLSIALPRLDDLLLAGLESGTFPSCEGWSTQGALPVFLKEFWDRIFRREDGVLLPSPDVNSIIVIRQISRTYKKVFEVCSDDRVDRAVERYIDLDLELQPIVAQAQLIHVAHTLFGGIVGESMSSEHEFRHGPGAVSERLGSNERWNLSTISPRAEEHFGAESLRTSWIDLLDRPPVVEDIPARLVAVPKTAEKPRLIAIEPSYNQFFQQGLHTELKIRLATSGSIAAYEGRQSRNQRAALRASADRSFSTIDLSDASDRVDWLLVQTMFSWNPGFVNFLRNSRSEWIQLPCGREHPLGKFASMGSALTFPIEAMVFSAIVVFSICKSEKDFSRSNILKWGSEKSGVCVYGDDIIVPTRFHLSVVEDLIAAGMAVNERKSFFRGGFRESCGTDAFDGTVVTPVYVRSHFFGDRPEALARVSALSFRNQLWAAKLWPSTVKFLDQIDALQGFPYGDPEWGSIPVRYKESSTPPKTRWNVVLQRMEAHVPTVVPVERTDEIDGYAALSKSLRTPLSHSEDHLIKAGRPIAMKIHNRWVSKGTQDQFTDFLPWAGERK